MKEERLYLDFYNECIKTGVLPNSGLCRVDLYDENMDIFRPTAEYNRSVGYDDYDDWYWGYNGERQNGESDYERRYRFTPMRQTIVLFLAAMNGEL